MIGGSVRVSVCHKSCGGLTNSEKSGLREKNNTNPALQMASITGAPATFELQRPETTETTYAEARLLNYNFGTGVVEFSGNAIITEGGNQISSNYLIYNIAEQRINAQSAGVDGERVKIKYTPNTVQTEATPDATTDSEAGADPVSENESTPGADGDDGS